MMKAKKEKNLNRDTTWKWLKVGIVVSLAAAIIFVACYGLFQNKAAAGSENQVESQDNVAWLYRNNQLLYRDLYNKMNGGNISYTDLYYPLMEIEAENSGIMMQDTSAEEAELIEEEELWNLSQVLSYVEEYYNRLELDFSQLSNVYDYFIQNIQSGDYVTNTANKDGLSESEYFFLLTFQYDSMGNVTVGEAVQGDNSDKVRRYANEAARSGSAASFDAYYDEILAKYTEETAITNCSISYGITYAMWARLQTQTDFNVANYWGFMNAGCGGFYLLCLLVIFLSAFFLPIGGLDKSWARLKIFRIPFEVLMILGFIILLLTEYVVSMAARVSGGNFAAVIMAYIPVLEQYHANGAVTMFSYLVNVLLLIIPFLTAWYLGICIQGIRKYGLLKYLKEKCLTYRFFPYVKDKVKQAYDALQHFDVTKNSKKIIRRIILVNAVVLFLTSSLWFGGIAVVIVYSVILYFILRKFASDLQKKYSILLNATNEIAEGNLNVSITEDIGIFEPFKPQIIRIQRGFRNAVEEEVKSQRMKAELITNVSHDLKTPLTAIITYIDLLKDDNLEAQKRQEYLATLDKKAHRLKVLIEDLFEVSKATSKNVTLNIMDVDIMNLVKQVALEMSDKLTQANLDVRFNLTDAKVILPLDSQKTYRIYENLFGNITKYALPGTRVYVSGFQIDDTVVITLKNITAQEIDVDPAELTDRFVRGDSSRNAEGSGLGLSIAKSFLELQNGRLTIEVDGDLFKAITTWTVPT